MSELQEYIGQSKTQFHFVFEKEADFTIAAPGRINIIGEHTDYNGGLSLPAAINRWVIISAKKRNDNKVRINSINYNSWFEFELGKEPPLKDKWEYIVYGAFSLFKNAYGISEGLEAQIWGNIPIGSGVSSSAAIEVAFTNTLKAVYNLPVDDLTLVKYCQEIEHKFLKVKSGLLDQFSSQFGKANKLLLLDFNDLSHEYFEADLKGWLWVLVNSNVKRELADSKYSERVNETAEALARVKTSFPAVKTFRDVQRDHLKIFSDKKDEVLKKRMLHYIEENQRVMKTIEGLSEKNIKAIGNLLTSSHNSLRDNYEVSCKEVDFLVKKALEYSYCAGSRIMGGGFGGCTINLVEEVHVAEFKKNISEAYKKEYKITAEINIYQVVDGAVAVNHSLNKIKDYNQY